MDKESFGTQMYEKKYVHKTEDVPRTVVVSFVDNHLTDSKNCLDLGCGSGRHSRYVAEKGISVTGIDVSLEGVKRTEQVLSGHPDSQALVADAHQLPLPDQSFDSLISNRVLDYNDDKGLEEAFSEMSRVVRERGPVLITLRSITQPPKNNEALFTSNEQGGRTYRVQEGIESGAMQHYFSEQEIRKLAADHDFEIFDIKEQQKTNEHGEFKAEWQVILRKLKKSKEKDKK